MMQKVGAGLTSMNAIPTFPMGLVAKDDATRGSIASTYTWKTGGTGVMGPIVFGQVAAAHAMANTPAEGYEVKAASNLLDEALFAKEVSTEKLFDMTQALTDGEYTATVDGQNGPMTVKVVVAEGKIASVEIVSHQETEGIAKAAFETVPAAIVANNDATVDTVAGATLTSNRIMNAVAQCLESAAK